MAYSVVLTVAMLFFIIGWVITQADTSACCDAPMAYNSYDKLFCTKCGRRC